MALSALDALKEPARRIDRANTSYPETPIRQAAAPKQVRRGNIGALARLDFTVIGATVNRTVRLQELASDHDLDLVISGSWSSPSTSPTASVTSPHRFRVAARRLHARLHVGPFAAAMTQRRARAPAHHRDTLRWRPLVAHGVHCESVRCRSCASLNSARNGSATISAACRREPLQGARASAGASTGSNATPRAKTSASLCRAGRPVAAAAHALIKRNVSQLGARRVSAATAATVALLRPPDDGAHLSLLDHGLRMVEAGARLLVGDHGPRGRQQPLPGAFVSLGPGRGYAHRGRQVGRRRRRSGSCSGALRWTGVSSRRSSSAAVADRSG